MLHCSLASGRSKKKNLQQGIHAKRIRKKKKKTSRRRNHSRRLPRHWKRSLLAKTLLQVVFYPYIQRLVSFQYLAKNSPQLRVKYQYGYNCHTCCRIVSTQSSCLHWPCFYVWKVNILLCRLLYGIFYKKQGGALNKVRMVGALLCLAALLANTGIFSVNFFKSLGK